MSQTYEVIATVGGYRRTYYDDIQKAVTDASAIATAANPVTIRLTAGIYTLKTSLSVPSNTVGLNIAGSGKDATIFRPSASWYDDLGNGVTSNPDFINLNNLTSAALSGFTVDLLTNDPLTWGFATNRALAAIGWTALAGNGLTLSDIRLKGIGFGWRTQAPSVAGTPPRIYLNNSLIEARGVAIEAGNEHWAARGSTIAATNNTTAYYGTQTRAAGAGADGLVSRRVVGYSFGVVSTGGTSMFDGCFLNADDERTGAGAGGSAIALRTIQNNATDSWIHLAGCTLLATHKATSPDDNAGSDNIVAAVGIPTGSTIAGRISLEGCLLAYETATNAQGFYSGGIVMDSTTASSLTIHVNGGRFESFGGSLSVTAANGIQGRRGDVVYTQASGTPPTVNITGTQMSGTGSGAGITAPIATAAIQNFRSFGGTATLSSGVARVLLIVNGGAAGGSPAFDSTSTAVTSGTGFTTAFTHGDFIRRTSDNDNDWTRVKSIESATALTLEENYRGVTGTSASSGGRQNQQTQPDTAYRVIINAGLTGETFSVTEKHETGFLITSSNGASTATVDWVVVR